MVALGVNEELSRNSVFLNYGTERLNIFLTGRCSSVVICLMHIVFAITGLQYSAGRAHAVLGSAP
jgi:hypothetical protein